jgi:nicotinamide riboside kinase
MKEAWVVALVGAESTGKTTLARDIATALEARGLRVAVVDEVLREFCALRNRTPRQDEQEGLALEQTRRIATAADSGAVDVVVADTTALMIAVYSDFVFGDHGLYDAAEAAQRDIDLTLLTALDLPWQADGLQRDGAHVREPVDAMVRASLGRAGVAFETIDGSGRHRLAAALAAIDRVRARPTR